MAIPRILNAGVKKKLQFNAVSHDASTVRGSIWTTQKRGKNTLENNRFQGWEYCVNSTGFDGEQGAPIEKELISF